MINKNYSANLSRQTVLNFYRENDIKLKELKNEVLKHDKNELIGVYRNLEQFTLQLMG